MSLQQLAPALVIAAMVLLLGVVAFTSVAAHMLRSRFPDVWQSEGQPREWLWLQRTSAQSHVLGFLDERRYLATNDDRYIRLCAILRVGWYAALLLFLVAFAVLAAVVLA